MKNKALSALEPFIGEWEYTTSLWKSLMMACMLSLRPLRTRGRAGGKI